MSFRIPEIEGTRHTVMSRELVPSLRYSDFLTQLLLSQTSGQCKLYLNSGAMRCEESCKWPGINQQHPLPYCPILEESIAEVHFCE